MRKVWLILIAVTLILGLIGYTYLGGFSEPKISIKESDNITVIGYPYYGQLNKKGFSNLFKKSDSLVLNGIIDGKVAGIFYNQPSKSSDSIRTFVGVIPKETTVVPDGLEKRVFPVKKVVEADLKAHYLIMPFNIYPKIKEFSKENNLKLAEESIEIYESDMHLRILSPLKEK